MQGLGPPWTPRGQLLAWVTQPQGQDKEPVLFPPGKVPVPLKPPPTQASRGREGRSWALGTRLRAGVQQDQPCSQVRWGSTGCTPGLCDLKARLTLSVLLDSVGVGRASWGCLETWVPAPALLCPGGALEEPLFLSEPWFLHLCNGSELPFRVMGAGLMWSDPAELSHRKAEP